MKKNEGWRTSKPTAAGIYQVRGFNYGKPKKSQVIATVNVETSTYKDDKRVLVCNLHEGNSEPNHERWSRLSDLSENFEWRGPFILEPSA